MSDITIMRAYLARRRCNISSALRYRLDAAYRDAKIRRAAERSAIACIKLARRIYIREYNRRRKAHDPLFAITAASRSRIATVMKRLNLRNRQSLERVFGAKLDVVRTHIESTFLPGMTWANHGEWHIDHVRPLAAATSESELLALLHYKNTQALWAPDNLRKGARI